MTQHSPRRAHRYREDAENYGGATTFDAPFESNSAVAHGDWDANQAWNSDAQWNPDAQWNSDADWNPGEQWGRPQQWEQPRQWDESGYQPEPDWNAQTTVNGWAAPNPSDWAPQSRTNWDPNADPTPSDEYRPVYTFRTASGEKLQFSGDGARVNRAAREADADAPDDETRPTRSGGKRRAGGTHRLPAPPTALKGRAAVIAVAAGAVVAAGQATIETAGHDNTVDYQATGQVKEVAATSVVGDGGGTGAPQVVNPNAPASLDQFSDILEKGKQFAADMANQEAMKNRPLWTIFAHGTFTSGFGIRWGVAHQGVDIAAPIGTPIYAVADATVLEAGPASGFGMWVRLLHDDGTVTIYGHIDTATVSQGQRVLAGDQIATVGNRGFSTGPHCHFEVWLNGVDKIDPLPWLASRGISLGPERD